MVKKYKDSNTFEIDATKAAAGIYVIGFDDCKKKVSKAYSSLNLCLIIMSGILEGDEEEEEGEIAKELAIKGGDVGEEVTEVLAPKVAAPKAPEEGVTLIKVPKEAIIMIKAPIEAAIALEAPVEVAATPEAQT